jgi:hypothetical protein
LVLSFGYRVGLGRAWQVGASLWCCSALDIVL